MNLARGRRMTAIVAACTALAVGGATLLVTSSSAGAGSRTCLGRKATIVGTASGDNIYGTNGTDVIVGGRGNDQIHGLGGDDFICGEGGRDIITGGSGDDTLIGGDQADELHGGGGDDYMQGDAFTNYRGDSCDGGDGIDSARSDCEHLANVP